VYKRQEYTPAKFLITWSSNDKCFTFYDKELKKDVLVPLPFKFIWLKSMVRIGGFNKKRQSGITSNDVSPYELKKEELEVVSYKGGVIAKGFYKDIKDTISNAGSKYGTLTYAVLRNGDLANVWFLGAAQGSWYDFNKENFDMLTSNYVVIKSFKEEISGTTVYYTPIIELGDVISSDDEKTADAAYEVVESHINGKSPRQEEANEPTDDLPF
jgi:hypothetical protein